MSRGGHFSRAMARLLLAAGFAAAAGISCAAAGGAAGGGEPSGGGESEVLLRVGGESFTRADLDRENPNLLTPRGTHSKGMRSVYVKKFVDFRLLVQEARRRGLESAEGFAKIELVYVEARGAELLLEGEAPEVPLSPESVDAALKASPGRSREEVVGELRALGRQEQIRSALRSCGIPTAPRFLVQPVTPAYLTGEPATVLAELGAVRITVGEVRRAVSGREDVDEDFLTTAVGGLLEAKALIAAAQQRGYCDQVRTLDEFKRFQEKILEKLLVEELVPPGSLSDEQVAGFYAANEKKYRKGQAEPPPLESIAATVRRDAESAARAAKVGELVESLRATTTIWTSELLTR